MTSLVPRTRARLACALALASLVAACGGGESGTGISTTQGNVSDASSSRLERRTQATRSWLAFLNELLVGSRAIATGAVGDISVSIEGSGIQDLTDDSGSFRLAGGYFGPVTIRFERTEDGLLGRIGIDIPAGGTIVLHDVTIDRVHQRAIPSREDIAFPGGVIATDCFNGRAFVASRFRPFGETYAVDTNTSTTRDVDGSTITCRDLRGGDPVDVQGTVQSDGSIGGGTIQRRPR